MAGTAIPYKRGGVAVAINSPAQVAIEPAIFRCRLTGLLFDTNKTFLLPMAFKGMKVLKKLFAAHSNLGILVNGHTDRVGGPDANLKLSEERAKSIEAFLKDDADFWLQFYKGRPGSATWGTTEDKKMQDALGEKPDGPMNEAKRKKLIQKYMEQDGSPLTAGAHLETHGCGEFHNEVPTADNVAEQKNRRVELFLFDPEIGPRPRPKCPGPDGCEEYEEWKKQTVFTVDLDQDMGTLAVRVTDKADKPIAEATVHISGPLPEDGKTDASGAVTFQDVIPGKYTVFAEKDGFEDGQAQVAVAPGGGGASGPSDGPSDASSSAKVVLESGTGDLSIVVTNSVTGAGIGGATVDLVTPTGPQSLKTDGSGTLTVSGTPVGDYQVKVSAGTFNPSGTQSIKVGANTTAGLAVKLTPAVQTGALTITVTDGAAKTAIAGATVDLKTPTGTQNGLKTDATGVITIDPAPAGAYTVTVTQAGFAKSTTNVTVGVGSNTSHVVKLTGTTGKLAVTVKSKDDNKPIEGAIVSIKERGFNATTDAKGVVDFGNVEPGAVTIRTEKDGFGPDATKVAAIETPATLTVSNNNVTVTMTAVPVGIKIKKIDDHFAPGPEKLVIEYSSSSVASLKVLFRIEAENYKDKLILERELTADEKKDGDHKLEWDGKIAAGDRKDRLATPLFGPYKVLFTPDGGKGKDEKAFKILYHSIELAFGKHTHDGAVPPEAEQNRFAIFKLNELGYDAGPVSATLDAVSQNAIRRFQRGNFISGSQTLLTENGTLDANTFAAIKAASARLRFEAGKDPLKVDARFYIHDGYYSDRGVNVATTGQPDFFAGNRKTSVEDKLERPFVPLEVEVKLLGKGGGAVSSPDAVGPVTIAWEADDGAEDASVIAAGNATARTFVKNGREKGLTAAGTGAAAINASGDNASDALWGMRPAAAADYVKAWFPDAAGSALDPFKVRGYDKETRSAKEFHRALVDCHDHATEKPSRKGRAGVYFRFSTKGGDDAKIRVALTFEGRPNKDKLVEAHKPQAASLVKETGRWTVWRRTRLSAYVQQTAPTRASGSPNWASIAAKWGEAFIEFENAGQPLTILNYATIVPEATYKAAILAMASPPPGVTNAASLTYRPSMLYGGPAFVQNPPSGVIPAETAAAFVGRVQTRAAAWCGTTGGATSPLVNAILAVIHAHVRKTSAEGLIIYDYRVHDPVNGQDFDAGTATFKPNPSPAVNNVKISHLGWVQADGAVTMNVDNRFDVNCYVLHECGHARYLYHHKAVVGATAATPTSNATHHDPAQERCTMSYTISPDTPEAWTYSFCGKCILRLRGWDVKASLPPS
ncbi:MAG: carboxypeptidase regulatory-like domain-containing protein [Planctomycetota bacterium]